MRQDRVTIRVFPADAKIAPYDAEMDSTFADAEELQDAVFPILGLKPNSEDKLKIYVPPEFNNKLHLICLAGRKSMNPHCSRMYGPCLVIRRFPSKPDWREKNPPKYVFDSYNESALKMFLKQHPPPAYYEDEKSDLVIRLPEKKEKKKDNKDQETINEEWLKDIQRHLDSSIKPGRAKCEALEKIFLENSKVLDDMQKDNSKLFTLSCTYLFQVRFQALLLETDKGSDQTKVIEEFERSILKSKQMRRLQKNELLDEQLLSEVLAWCCKLRAIRPAIDFLEEVPSNKAPYHTFKDTSQSPLRTSHRDGYQLCSELVSDDEDDASLPAAT